MNMNLIHEIINDYHLPKWIPFVFAFITLLPIFFSAIKSLFKLSQLINLKRLRKSKDILFPIIAVAILPFAFTFLNISLKSFFTIFNFNYNYYLCLIGILTLTWLTIYIILGFQDPMKLSLISTDLKNYNQYMKKKYMHQKHKESQFFSQAINNSKYTNSKFKSIKKSIKNEYNFNSKYIRLKITKSYTRLVNTLVIIGCTLNGFLIYILFIAGKDPTIIFIYIFIILIFAVQFYHLYRLNISTKNYDHLKYYREDNNVDD